MLIGKRIFISPILIHKTESGYGGDPNLSIRWDKSKMGGTMKTTSYTLEIATRKKKWQWAFCWRPDVTRYWWKDSKKKSQNSAPNKQ